MRHFFGAGGLALRALELCGPELAGRQVGTGEPNPVAKGADGDQIVGLGGLRGVHRRSRRHHPRHLALHQLLGKARLFHLLADGHPVALLNQPVNVALDGVVGNAAHGDRRAAFFIARGQGDLQLARRHHRVFVKHLVEVPQPEKQKGLGVLLLDCGVLPHERCRRLRHLLTDYSWPGQF